MLGCVRSNDDRFAALGSFSIIQSSLLYSVHTNEREDGTKPVIFQNARNDLFDKILTKVIKRGLVVFNTCHTPHGLECLKVHLFVPTGISVVQLIPLLKSKSTPVISQ